jgi:cytochrome P450
VDVETPPGPSLPASIQSLAYHRDPLGVLRRARARYGPVFTLRFPLKDPIVFVALADALPGLLESDPGHAHAGEARRAILPQASPRSPFGGDGEAHHASRSRMWPAFAPERIAAIEPELAALAREHVARWPSGRPFRLLEATRSLCTDVTVRLVLGVDDERRRAALVSAIRSMLNTPGNPPLPIPGGDEGPAGVVGALGDREFARRSADVRALLAHELDTRRLRDDAGEDLLGALLRAEPAAANDELIDEMLIVLFAAQEPPAIALANVMYELARRPRLAEQCLAEPGLRDAVVAEVLRLRPSASAALRRLTEPLPLNGRVLARGTTVACPSLLLHRDPSVFSDPDAFRPERFADGSVHAATYMPFGGGARRCIGQALAEAEFRALLPAALERVRLRPVWPREERMVVRATVLVPHRGAAVIARPR